MKHAKYSPSSLARLLACPGCLKLCQEVPSELQDTSSNAAREGTELHSLVEHGIMYGRDTIPYEDKSPEQRRAVETVMDYLDPYIQGEYDLYSETCVSMTDEVWGTADIIAKSDTELHILDAKFGRVPVEVEDNAQLMAHMCGGR